MISPHEVVTRSLGGRIGAVRIILCRFVEELLAVSQMVLRRGGRSRKRRLDTLGMRHFQCPIHLVSRDMVEKFAFKALGARTPIAMSCLEHRKGSHDIGPCKGEGILDGTVHVAFGRQMDNAVHLILPHQRKDGIEITDIGLDEGIIRCLLDILQIGQIPGIGQFVEVDNMIVGIFRNESRTTCEPIKPAPPVMMILRLKLFMTTCF